MLKYRVKVLFYLVPCLDHVTMALRVQWMSGPQHTFAYQYRLSLMVRYAIKYVHLPQMKHITLVWDGSLNAGPLPW